MILATDTRFNLQFLKTFIVFCAARALEIIAERGKSEREERDREKRKKREKLLSVVKLHSVLSV